MTREAAIATRRPDASELRLADVLASLADALIVVDADGRVRHMNAAAEQLTDIAESQAVGEPIGELFGTRSSNAWLGGLVLVTLSDGVPRGRTEATLHRRLRPELPLSATCTPVYGPSGALAGAVLALHDNTLQHSLDATTRAAEQFEALGAVTLGLAHEIRNPLGGIRGAAQLLRGGLGDPRDVECTDVIIREVERLDGLLERLRELGTPLRLQVAPVNIHRILLDVVALQRRAPEWGTIELREEFDPSLPPVLGDAARLTQVFLNLVKNAVESLSGHGVLTIATRMESRYLVRRRRGREHHLSVVVIDDGPGVAEEMQSRLFAPYFTTKAKGTGLGLAICHRVVSEHGGAITYEAPAGGGAAFRVTLPVSESESYDG